MLNCIHPAATRWDLRSLFELSGSTGKLDICQATSLSMELDARHEQPVFIIPNYHLRIMAINTFALHQADAASHKELCEALRAKLDRMKDECDKMAAQLSTTEDTNALIHRKYKLLEQELDDNVSLSSLQCFLMKMTYIKFCERINSRQTSKDSPVFSIAGSDVTTIRSTKGRPCFSSLLPGRTDPTSYLTLVQRLSGGESALF